MKMTYQIGMLPLMTDYQMKNNQYPYKHKKPPTGGFFYAYTISGIPPAVVHVSHINVVEHITTHPKCFVGPIFTNYLIINRGTFHIFTIFIINTPYYIEYTPF
jgi:hypothetical protein